jgi:hypothetical protein
VRLATGAVVSRVGLLLLGYGIRLAPDSSMAETRTPSAAARAIVRHVLGRTRPPLAHLERGTQVVQDSVHVVGRAAEQVDVLSG